MNVQQSRKSKSQSVRVILYCGTLLIAGSAYAQEVSASTVTLPGSTFATTEGNSRVVIPFDTPGRLQVLYQSSMFPNSRMSITGVRVRADGGVWPHTNYSNSEFTIDASSTNKLASTLSATFANNHGTDRTVVFNGPLSFSYGSDSTPPNPFGDLISFSTPFNYDPTGGQSLLLNFVTAVFLGVEHGAVDIDRQLGVTGAGLVLALDPSAASGHYVGTSEAAILQLQYSTLINIAAGNPSQLMADGVAIDFSSTTTSGELAVSRNLLDSSSIILPGDFVVPGAVLQSWNLGFNNSAISGPVSLVFHYDESLLAPGTREEELRIYHAFSDQSGSQILIPIIDTNLNTLTVTVDRFSEFSVIAAVPEPTAVTMFGLGAMGVAGAMLRRRARAKGDLRL